MELICHHSVIPRQLPHFFHNGIAQQIDIAARQSLQPAYGLCRQLMRLERPCRRDICIIGPQRLKINGDADFDAMHDGVEWLLAGFCGDEDGVDHGEVGGAGGFLESRGSGGCE